MLKFYFASIISVNSTHLWKKGRIRSRSRIWLIDPDSPKTCESCGSESSTLTRVNSYYTWKTRPREWEMEEMMEVMPMSATRVSLPRIITSLGMINLLYCLHQSICFNNPSICFNSPPICFNNLSICFNNPKIIFPNSQCIPEMTQVTRVSGKSSLCYGSPVN